METYQLPKYKFHKYLFLVGSLAFNIYLTFAYSRSNKPWETRFQLLLAYVIIGFILVVHRVIYIIQWIKTVGYEFPNRECFLYWESHLGLNPFFPTSKFLELANLCISISILYFNWNNFLNRELGNISDIVLYLLNIITLIYVGLLIIIFLVSCFIMALCGYVYSHDDYNLRRRQIVELIPIHLRLVPNNLVGDDVCGICLDNPTELTWVELKCKHRFHQHCMTTYLQHPNTTKNCPFCRMLIESESAV